jgi:hypothetical protein
MSPLYVVASVANCLPRSPPDSQSPPWDSRRPSRSSLPPPCCWRWPSPLEVSESVPCPCPDATGWLVKASGKGQALQDERRQRDITNQEERRRVNDRQLMVGRRDRSGHRRGQTPVRYRQRAWRARAAGRASRPYACPRNARSSSRTQQRPRDARGPADRPTRHPDGTGGGASHVQGGTAPPSSSKRGSRSSTPATGW